MTVRFVKSLPEQYQVLLEYWEEKKKEKVEEEETEEEDETEGNYTGGPDVVCVTEWIY